MSLDWKGTEGNIECWRAIPGYEGIYEVSTLGQLRSLDRMARTSAGHLKRIAGQPLKQGYVGAGYPSFVLAKNGKKRTRTVHSLVLLAFVGPRPSGMEVRHLNGMKTDNRLTNLAYGTRSDNVLDTVRHGTYRGGKLIDLNHCSRNHEFTPENTGRDPDGYRYCRSCRQIHQRHYRNRQKASTSC